MTDEEMARKYALERKKNLHLSQRNTSLIHLAYLHGLKDGKPKWHYISEGEYPKECSAVLCYCKGPGFNFCCVGHILIVGGKVRWWANNKSEELLVIAWKEIVLPKKEDEKTHISKVTTTILCPTCKVPMLRCQYYGGGIYWTCGKCGYEVESTGL